MTAVLLPIFPAHSRLLAEMHRICFVEPWDEAAMGGVLTMPGTSGVLASEPSHGASPERKPAPQGFLLWRTAADEAEVLTLLVLPPYRRTGVAGRLLDHAIDAVRQAGVQAFFLEVASDNAAGRALYSSRHFEQVGMRPRYYRNSIDAIIMKRKI
ncbi:GNAT family N-acetyltransferase [Telmatospirillum sp.]|uniref:GNAT family N-acetyltransferase n=1 Tax=Telmatospirillum sp. TaxID=2079197 RepID=UPI00284C996B|nr:GNAT family N-acetyltransferase [Telmatospirillum sp.]MDR3440414.1 GNAT family N-acetyltransferase [Telmatospirillum sp.]